MSDGEVTDLIDVKSAISGLPAPIRASFLKSVNELLGGLTAIPAAWLHQKAQAIGDRTIALSTVSGILATATAHEAKADPIVMQAAAEIYLPTIIRKAKNRISVAQSAASHIANAQPIPSVAPSPPDDDWMNSFMRGAEDASSERLQDLFGRILAGEVVRPGSFSSSTLRAVSELDQSIATDFSSVWAFSVGKAVDFGSFFQRGEGFSRWSRLVEAGLMASREHRQHLPQFVPIVAGNGLWSPIVSEQMFLLVHYQEGSDSSWTYIEFTKTGREIGSLLPPPDYEANFRIAAMRLPQDGIVKIELHRAGQPAELLWQSSG